jgi:hypothetical protein
MQAQVPGFVPEGQPRPRRCSGLTSSTRLVPSTWAGLPSENDHGGLRPATDG